MPAKAGGNNRGSIVASKRFDDDANPNTPCEWENKYFFYNYDMRGSTTAIIKPEGEAVTQYAYDEYGNLSQTGEAAFKNEVTFTSSISDTSTGLQYMNSRYYDSSTGRFISQDTYTGNPYDPWTQNLYSYCSGNPTNFIDPTGHSAQNAYTGRVYEDKAGYFSIIADNGSYSIYPLFDGGDFGVSYTVLSEGDRNYVLGKIKNFAEYVTSTKNDIQSMGIKDKDSPVGNVGINTALNTAMDHPSDYKPKYNIGYDEWTPEMWEYNCLGYALGTNIWERPASGDPDYMMEQVKNKLAGYNVSGVMTGTEAKNYQLKDNETMIAGMINGAQAHFMKNEGGSGWTQKYEYSTIMDFNGAPWDYTEGIGGEFYFYGWRENEDVTFTQDQIRYLVYSK